MIYYINTVFWFVLAIIGAFILKSMDYSYFALTIAMLWHVAGCVVRDINKNA